MSEADLHEFARKVDRMIAGNHRAIQRFQKCIRDFNAYWRAYWEAKCDEPQPYEDPTGNERKPGYEYDADFRMWFPVDDPAPVPDPLAWDISDKASCYYTALAVVYDVVKGSYSPAKLCEGILDHFCFYLVRRGFEQGSFDPERLETALAWVRADLAICGQAKDEGESKGPFGFHAPTNGTHVCRYVFKNEGATWRIFYGEHETTVKDCKGVRYIHHLVREANTRIECLDIERACCEETHEGPIGVANEEAMDAGLHSSTYDLKQLDRWDASDIEKAIERLRSSIEDTDDSVRKGKLEVQARQLEEYLRKSQNIHGEPRSIGPKTKARDRVQKAVNAAKRLIEKGNKQIGQHFHSTVKADGTAFIYKPDRKLAWIFE